VNNPALRAARDALLGRSTALVVRALRRFVGLPIDDRTVTTVARATKRVVDATRATGRNYAYRDYVQVVGSDPVPPLELHRFTDDLWSSVISRVTEQRETFTADVAREIALEADFWSRDAINGQRIDAAKKDPRVGRIARVDWNPPACPFCTLLNSRGPVYVSQESALRTIHNGDECDLVYVPAGTEDTYPGIESTRIAEAAYRDAVEASDRGTTEEVLRELKLQQPDRPVGRVQQQIVSALEG